MFLNTNGWLRDDGAALPYSGLTMGRCVKSSGLYPNKLLQNVASSVCHLPPDLPPRTCKRQMPVVGYRNYLSVTGGSSDLPNWRYRL